MDSISYYIKEESFKGKNVLITGSTGGIGSVVTEAFILAGANVIAVARNEKKVLERFKKYLNLPSFKYELFNLENPSLINSHFKNIILKFQGKLDVLVLCHGQFKIGKLVETGVDVFDNTININVRSCFHLLSLATPFLKLSKGNVVAVTSTESKILVRDGFMNSVSKAMLNSLIECSSLELASFGVRVNGVAPAITATNHRVSEVFKENDNKEYLEKMGEFFLLNREVK